MAENKKIEAAKDEVTEAKKDVKKADKKPARKNRIGKFFREYRAEMKKVTWASRKDTIRNAIVVAITVVVVGGVIGGLDALFDLGIRTLGNII